MHDLSQEDLKNILHYDPETGEFTWLIRPSNSVALGARAGRTNQLGYRIIKIRGVGYQAHRLAWLYMTGAWPEALIDHINGIPGDNRFANLRQATSAQNCWNRKNVGPLPKGVSLLSNGSYQASFQNRYVGVFPSAEEAHEAYKDHASRVYGSFARFA